MSHRATTWAWQQQNLPALQKLVLLALADRHNNDTGRCDPSMQLVAEDCGMSRDSVKRAIKGLQESGLITAQERKVGTTNISNYYTLNMTPVGAISTGGGCSQHRGVGANSPTNLEVEPVIESGNLQTADALFPIEEKKDDAVEAVEAVWEFYKSKINKPTSTLLPERLKQGITCYKHALKIKNGNSQHARELMEIAIEQLADSDWHMGRDKATNGKTYNEWKHVFRTPAKFEEWLERSNG